MQIQKFFRYAIVTLVLFDLSACAWTGIVPSQLSQSDRRVLYKLDAWRFEGRLAVKTHNDSWHANLEWSHSFELDKLQLSGPFGQGATQILIYPDSIRITDSKGNTEVSENPGRTLERRFGFKAPLSALKYWVLGVTEPNAKNCIENDTNGFLRKIWHKDWEVFIKKYRVLNKYTVPKLIEIKNDDVILKLVIDRWSQGVE